MKKLITFIGAAILMLPWNCPAPIYPSSGFFGTNVQNQTTAAAARAALGITLGGGTTNVLISGTNIRITTNVVAGVTTYTASAYGLTTTNDFQGYTNQQALIVGTNYVSTVNLASNALYSLIVTTNTVNNLISNAVNGVVGTNFVLLTATGTNGDNALNDATKAVSSFNAALSALRQTPAAWSNGVIIIPPGQTILVTNSGVVGQQQTVRVFSAGATLLNTNNATTILFYSNASAVFVHGGNWRNHGVPTLAGRAFGFTTGSTNALLDVTGVDGFSTYDFIHRDQTVGSTLRNPVHVRLRNCNVLGAYDNTFLAPQHAGTNYTFTIEDSNLIADGQQDAANIPSGITASAGIWTLKNVSAIGTNGVQHAVGAYFYNGARVRFLGQNFFAGGSTNASCTKPWGILAENSTLDFSQSTLPTHEGFLTNFQSTVIPPAVTNSVSVLSTTTTNVTLTTNYSGAIRHYAITAAAGGVTSSNPADWNYLGTNAVIVTGLTGCAERFNGTVLVYAAGNSTWIPPGYPDAGVDQPGCPIFIVSESAHRLVIRPDVNVFADVATYTNTSATQIVVGNYNVYQDVIGCGISNTAVVTYFPANLVNTNGNFATIHVSGDATIGGTLLVSNVVATGTFTGDGTGLTNVPANYFTNADSVTANITLYRTNQDGRIYRWRAEAFFP